MKHLSKISDWVWAGLTFVIGVIFVVVYFILTMNIEQVINVKVTISKTNVKKLIINASDMTYIKEKDKIRIRFKKSFFDATIQSVENQNNGKVEVTLAEENENFIPSSVMDAEIIYSSIPVWQKIVNW